MPGLDLSCIIARFATIRRQLSELPIPPSTCSFEEVESCSAISDSSALLHSAVSVPALLSPRRVAISLTTAVGFERRPVAIPPAPVALYPRSMIWFQSALMHARISQILNKPLDASAVMHPMVRGATWPRDDSTKAERSSCAEGAGEVVPRVPVAASCSAARTHGEVRITMTAAVGIRRRPIAVSRATTLLPPLSPICPVGENSVTSNIAPICMHTPVSRFIASSLYMGVTVGDVVYRIIRKGKWPSDARSHSRAESPEQFTLHPVRPLVRRPTPMPPSPTTCGGAVAASVPASPSGSP